MLLFGSVLSFTNGCKKSDITANTNAGLKAKVLNVDWKISNYNDSGDDHTSYFTDYDFAFNTDGTVNAVKAGSTVNGTWSTGTDDSHVKMILNFGTTSPFEQLNEDWHVIEQTESKIQLEHVSGGGGGTDLLTFERL